MRLHALPGALLFALALAACGQKGPLYLPDEPAAEPPPAADAADEDVSEGG
ncbi:MAG TPA: lipoprotein [Gammaproteobacteria bacterium]|nr:lipoprotein [Gammaproteobacteria bacterium]